VVPSAAATSSLSMRSNARTDSVACTSWLRFTLAASSIGSEKAAKLERAEHQASPQDSAAFKPPPASGDQHLFPKLKLVG